MESFGKLQALAILVHVFSFHDEQDRPHSEFHVSHELPIHANSEFMTQISTQSSSEFRQDLNSKLTCGFFEQVDELRRSG